MGIDVHQTDDTSISRKFRYLFFLMGNVYSLGIACIGHFILHFTNLESSANELIVAAAVIASATSCVSFGLKAKAIKHLCKELETIVERGKPTRQNVEQAYYFTAIYSNMHRSLLHIRRSRTSRTLFYEVHHSIYNDWYNVQCTLDDGVRSCLQYLCSEEFCHKSMVCPVQSPNVRVIFPVLRELYWKNINAMF